MLRSCPDPGDPLGRGLTNSIAVGRVSQPELEGDREEDEGTLRGRTEREGGKGISLSRLSDCRTIYENVQVIRRNT